MSNDDKAGPMGGWFGTIGGFAGLGFALSIGEDLEPMGLLVLAFIFMFVGGMIGLVVENIVFRLILLAILLIEISARHVMWETIRTVFFSGP